MEKKILVAYFSATGTTARVARSLASATGAELFEIKPQQPYTKADLNWGDTNSRSSREMQDKAYRPAIDGKVNNMDEYDTVFLGFPIWWYIAPTIINSFLEGYDFSGKRIIPFATSGSSGLGQTLKGLKPSCAASVKWEEGKLLNHMNDADIKKWLRDLGL